MSDLGPNYDDDETQVDLPPPVFPSVGGTSAPGTGAAATGGGLFSRAADDPSGESQRTGQGRATPAWTLGGPGSSRTRWLVAGVATLAVVALVAGLTLLVGPRSGSPSAVAMYAPADTVTYVELRLDLPGDQRERLIAFMSKFPGFADPSSFDQKFDDTLNQMLISAGAGIDWNNDVDPWFGGQVALFSSTVSPSPGTPPSFTAAMSVADRGRLEVLLDEHVTSAGVSSEEYQGRQIWTLPMGDELRRVSFAVTDDVLLAGMRIEDVRAALDVRADEEPGLADDAYFLQQLAALHADRLATFYYDGAGAAESMAGQLGADVPGLGLLDLAIDMSSVRVVGELRAEPTYMSLVSRSERSANTPLPPLPGNETTALAARMAPDTLVFAEFHDVGRQLSFLIDRALQSGPDGQSPIEIRAIEQLLGSPAQDFLDFLDDVAIGVAPSGDGIQAGLVASVDDEAIARVRIERLLSTLRALSVLGGGITIEDVAHGDATLTVIKLGILVPVGSLGSISLTVTGGQLLIGMDDFVPGALDRAAGDSLAAQDGFSDPIGLPGAGNTGAMFVDVAAVRERIATMLPADMQSRFENEYRPFVEPIDRLVVVNRNEDGIGVGHVFLYVE